MKGTVAPAAMLALAMGCGGHTAGPTPGGYADVIDASGNGIGSVTLHEQTDGVLIRTNLKALPAGLHGFHIHAVGKCEAPFDNAGGHFNPTGRKHGSMNPDGPHSGDLANLPVTERGTARVELLARGITLQSLFDDDGSALVVHAAPDDYKTDPSGSSGARIACGVIRRP